MMSQDNKLQFTVSVKDDGLPELAQKIDQVDAKTDELGKTAGTTGQQLDDMGKADKIKPLASTVDQVVVKTAGLGKTAGTTGKSLEDMGASAAPALGGVQTGAAKAAEGVSDITEQLNQVKSGLLALGVGSSLVGMIQSAAATADEYNNLAARIKLATGEGEAFEAAMAGVQQIALDTNSSLQGTGDLFARLTETGKSAGLSTQAAASQALALTESINQAVQLSGASAQASDAALQQLIQGLNGGALRGEEFNSVMEQSPRLAKALADGLGVTTGELRKMAEQGRLTSDVVITALQNQADTLKSEFETLPATVGRAVQNLSTAWMVYVGEADKATGASALAAQAIDTLASNLSTLAGYLLDAGQAGAAFVALRLAQSFLGLGVAAQTAAVQVTASATAITAAGAASNTAAASVGRFAGLLSGLKTFSLLGIVTNFQDIGTWIGESIAKLQGYKDATDELAAADKARADVAAENLRIAEAQTAANKAAMDAQFQLSAAAKASLTAFDDLVAKGKTASEAIAEIGKDFDLASLPGIANAAAVLDKLAADGKISASQFGAAWANALKGEDLQAFEVRARAAMAGTARESEKLAAVMEGTLREAIRRSGADFDVLSGGMSKAARSAINDTDTIINGLDRLRAQGVDVGAALEASLNKAIKTADSQAAIEALRSRVEQLRTVLGDKVADGLLAQIEDQAKKATGALSGLDGALQKLGITSDASLKKAAAQTRTLYEEVVKTGGSAREQAQAFEKMASAAIASGDSASLAFVKSKAEAHGFEVAVDAAGKTIVRAMGSGKDAIDTMSGSTRNLSRDQMNLANSINTANAALQKQRTLLNEKYGSPLGNDKYGAPTKGSVTGNNREERLAGQNAVDNTLALALRDKLNAGQLTPDDADNIRAVIAALDQNEAINRDLDRLNPGAFSSAGAADRAEWRNIRTRLEQALNAVDVGRTPNVSTPTPTSTSHTVTIKLGGSTTTVNTASARDADALSGLLASLQDAASRAA